MKIGRSSECHSWQLGHDVRVGQATRRQMHSSKQESLWISALQVGYEQRSQLMKRPDVSQVDVGLRNGVVVLTCFKERREDR